MEAHCEKIEIDEGVPPHVPVVYSPWPAFLQVQQRGVSLRLDQYVEAFKNIFFREMESFASWWVFHFMEGFPDAPEIRASELWKRNLSPIDSRGQLSIEITPMDVSAREAMIEEMYSAFFYDYDFEKGMFLKRRGGATAAECRVLEIPVLPCLKLAEPGFPIPVETDPRIYHAHSDRDDCFLGFSDENSRMEGLMDAQAAISYLEAYLSLIESPSVETLFQATKTPRARSGYMKSMAYIHSEGISQPFISLLHAAFFVQMAARTPPTLAAMTPVDQRMLSSLMRRYLVDHPTR